LTKNKIKFAFPTLVS